MLLKGSVASSDVPTQLANNIGKLLRLADHHASAEWPRVETEISQKKHSQRQQKFLPVMFHGQDTQIEVRLDHAISAELSNLIRPVSQRLKHGLVMLAQLRTQPARAAGRFRHFWSNRWHLDRRAIAERMLLEHLARKKLGVLQHVAH